MLQEKRLLDKKLTDISGITKGSGIVWAQKLNLISNTPSKIKILNKK